jgi:hypothetical protein
MPFVDLDFSSADPLTYEQDVYSFDYTLRLTLGETITGGVGPPGTIPPAGIWQMAVIQGIDANPNAHLIGLPQLNGNVVSQAIGGLFAGVTYRVLVTIFTSNSRTLTAYAHVTAVALS